MVTNRIKFIRNLNFILVFLITQYIHYIYTYYGDKYNNYLINLYSIPHGLACAQNIHNVKIVYVNGTHAMTILYS